MTESLTTALERSAQPQSPQWVSAMTLDDKPVPVDWAEAPDVSGAV